MDWYVIFLYVLCESVCLFFNDQAPTEISTYWHTLSLDDALPICGVVSTSGDVVFQGDIKGRFNAYSAKDGKLLWSVDAQTPLNSAPISYEAGGRQYIDRKSPRLNSSH